MKKNSILSSLVFIIFFSCSKDIEPEASLIHNRDVGLVIVLKDSIGNNLIDSEDYDSSNFRVYWKKNSGLELYYNYFNDNPYGYDVGTSNGMIGCGIAINDDPTVLISETYIKWNETDMDTISTFIERTQYSTIAKKFWYNSDLVWDEETMPNTEKVIVVVKS
jgi:hypothetical protein